MEASTYRGFSVAFPTSATYHGNLGTRDNIRDTSGAEIFVYPRGTAASVAYLASNKERKSKSSEKKRDPLESESSRGKTKPSGENVEQKSLGVRRTLLMEAAWEHSQSAIRHETSFRSSEIVFERVDACEWHASPNSRNLRI